MSVKTFWSKGTFSSVSNYKLFDFVVFKFDLSFYSKICAKYFFFYRELIYQYKILKNNLNLVIFAQIF